MLAEQQELLEAAVARAASAERRAAAAATEAKLCRQAAQRHAETAAVSQQRIRELDSQLVAIRNKVVTAQSEAVAAAEALAGWQEANRILHCKLERVQQAAVAAQETHEASMADLYKQLTAAEQQADASHAQVTALRRFLTAAQSQAMAAERRAAACQEQADAWERHAMELRCQLYGVDALGLNVQQHAYQQFWQPRPLAAWPGPVATLAGHPLHTSATGQPAAPWAHSLVWVAPAAYPLWQPAATPARAGAAASAAGAGRALPPTAKPAQAPDLCGRSRGPQMAASDPTAGELQDAISGGTCWTWEGRFYGTSRGHCLLTIFKLCWTVTPSHCMHACH